MYLKKPNKTKHIFYICLRYRIYAFTHSTLSLLRLTDCGSQLPPRLVWLKCLHSCVDWQYGVRKSCHRTIKVCDFPIEYSIFSWNISGFDERQVSKWPTDLLILHCTLPTLTKLRANSFKVIWPWSKTLLLFLFWV